MVKNGLFFAILVLLAVSSSFGQDIRNRYLLIEGSGARMDHVDFFRSNFAMEANGAGYVVTQSRAEARHTFKFSVAADTSDPASDQYIITISLYRNEDDAQLITFDFYYGSIDEMYTFTRTLFLNATANIPLPLLTEDMDQWKNKWFYFRASFDYPITFYLLQPIGLVGGAGLWGDMDGIGAPSPIGHEIMAMPGATLGVEFQRFDFLSFELNFQLSMGDTRNTYYINTAAGAEVKVPVKFNNIMLVPYGAFLFTFRTSPIFADFPPFAAGGGIQVCTRAGKSGAVFVDAKYMFSFGGNAVMHNPYLALPEEEQFYPYPEVIHYKRSHIGIGIGYKFGLLDRRK